MSAHTPMSTAAQTLSREREELVLRLLRLRGYRDVQLVSVTELNDDVVEALFTVPQVTADGVQRREARRAWICRASQTVQILDNWDVP